MKHVMGYLRDYFKYLIQKIIVSINPRIEINRYFNKAFGHNANLKSPKSLIEKIYWLQINSDTSSWSNLADKLLVRKYIEERGYASNLPKLYGVWENPDDIIFDLIQSKCVIKTNNGCGSVVIIHDKSLVDWKVEKTKLKKWLKIPFGYSGYQPHYLTIKPCILAEELLEQNQILRNISPESMVDFKFWCFNGHVESCLVTYGRSSKGLYIDLYDTDWNRIDHFLKDRGTTRVNHQVIIPRPECLTEMLAIASSLSKGQPQMRVDMYIVGDKPIIGELTMSTGYGYFTSEYYNYLGSLVDLSLLPPKR